MKLDAARSRIVIYTFAEGLFSALAHDLAIDATDLDGHLREGSFPMSEVPVSEVRVPVLGLVVRGAVKRGAVDRGALSAADRSAIARQIREAVIGPGEVVATGELHGTTARIAIVAPSGRAQVTCDVEVVRGETRGVRGTVDLSLRALGIAPVKGPLGAFKVKDSVRVMFDLAFVDGAS